MILYELHWYLANEDREICILITDKETAERKYKVLKSALDKGCWVSLKEWVEDDDHVLKEGEVLHYNDI